MVIFNFIIYYKPEVKMYHVDFASRIEIFLPKDSINDYINTLKKQKLSDYS